MLRLGQVQENIRDEVKFAMEDLVIQIKEV